MKKHRRIILLFLLMILVFSVKAVTHSGNSDWLFNSAAHQEVENFVLMYHTEIETAYQAGNMPEQFGNQSYSLWNKDDSPKIEFILGGSGFGSSTNYYGCYYTPNDTPSAFQSGKMPLELQSNGSWLWTGEGDNRGMTEKIHDHWYYFEAHF